MNPDTKIFYLVNHLPHNKFLDTLAKIIHRATYGAAVYLPIILFALLRGNEQARHFAVALALGIALNFVINDLILKHLVRRKRPYHVLPKAIYIAKAPAYPYNQSFPSGQSAVAFLFATLAALTFSSPLGIALAFLFALTVAMDRVYMGHHYPADVIAGAIIGSAVAFLVFRF